MGQVDVGKALGIAWQHMARVLFKPFALKKWLALGFVSMLAWGGSGGNFPSGGGDWGSNNEPFPDMANAWDEAMRWIVGHVLLLVVAAALLIAISMFFAWLSAVLKGVYIEQLTVNPRAIREPFKRLTQLGTWYFAWEIALETVMIAVVGFLIVIPVAYAFMRTHSVALQVGSVVVAILVGLVGMVVGGLAGLFGRGFLLPIMYMRGVGATQGWRMLGPLLRRNAGQMVLYVLMLLAVSVGASIYTLIAILVLMVGFALPGGILALIGYLVWSAAGWSAAFWGYAVIAGMALVLALSYAASCAQQPVMVFQRTLALVVLGQADPSLAMIPGTIPPPPPDYGQMEGPQETPVPPPGG